MPTSSRFVVSPGPRVCPFFRVVTTAHRKSYLGLKDRDAQRDALQGLGAADGPTPARIASSLFIRLLSDSWKDSIRILGVIVEDELCYSSHSGELLSGEESSLHSYGTRAKNLGV